MVKEGTLASKRRRVTCSYIHSLQLTSKVPDYRPVVVGELPPEKLGACDSLKDGSMHACHNLSFGRLYPPGDASARGTCGSISRSA